MAGFVLIHGSFHGGWCFDPVARILRERGHRVAAPDLPGMGGDEAALRATTLAGWGAFALDQCGAMRREVGDAPVILAGHSRGGIVISEAAEADPAAMDALVYICAMMTPPDATPEMLAASSKAASPLAGTARRVLNDSGIEIDAERAAQFFAQLCPPDVAQAAAARLVTEPTGPLAAPPVVTAGRWGRVPRSYIECLHDLAIPHEAQRRMIDMAPGTATVVLEADHSPFYSAPEALADALEAATIS